MNAHYTTRPFADEFTANPTQDTLGAAILRGSSAFGGGLAITAILASIFAH